MTALTICSQVYSSGTSSFSSTETAPLWSFNILLALGRGRWDHSYIVRGFIWEVGYQHFSPWSKERALHSPLPYSFKSLLFFFFLYPLSFLTGLGQHQYSIQTKRVGIQTEWYKTVLHLATWATQMQSISMQMFNPASIPVKDKIF